MEQSKFAYKSAALYTITIFLLIFLMIEGPITTPARYLSLADDRTWLHIPNAWNVLSNLPFIVFGLMGLGQLINDQHSLHFENTKEKIFYFIFFLGIFFVGFGSGFYHLVPNNWRMMWDRFPIAIAMMAFLSAIIAERINLSFARFLLWPLLLLGLWSVYYWYFTVELGREDLRPYTFVLTFFPLIIIPVILWMFRSPYSKTYYIWYAIILFILARITETFDLAIYNALDHFISGHSIKHLLLACSSLLIYLYLTRRKSAA